MLNQSAVTVRAEVVADRGGQLQALLVETRRRGPEHPDLPLARLDGVHFARLFVLPATTDLAGRVIPATLVYMADVDGSVESHLADLAAGAGAGVDSLFGHCTGYPAAPDVAERHRWLVQHTLTPAAYYVHCSGRTVAQIKDEALLRGELEDLLDEMQPQQGVCSPRTVRRRIIGAVRCRPDLSWALRGPAIGGPVERVSDLAAFAAVAVVVLVASPLLVPVLAAWLLLVRVKERRDTPEVGPPDQAHLEAVREYEDHATQNPFTAVGLVKAGVVRGVTMRVALRGLDLVCRRLFDRNQLVGLRTIHFARWLPLDDGRRVIFASSYDGSLESYMDDFIDRLHWGVNLVFSNGLGFPRTRWLVHDGARDEISYKHYLRRHQIPTVVFYSAYERRSARNIDTNTEIRRGLRRTWTTAGARRWLARL